MVYNEIDHTPVVYPTMEEFCDFQAYVTKLDEDSKIKGHGAVKVQLFTLFYSRSSHQKNGKLAKKNT